MTGVDIVLKGLNKKDIDSMLKIYNDLKDIKFDIEKKMNMLDGHIFKYLKQRKWERYVCKEHKINVSIVKTQKEKINKKVLKLLLNDEQYKQILKKKNEEKLMVVNNKDRERLKKLCQ